MPDLDVLAGMVWDENTRWPPGLTAQVRARSRKIGPGMYQVTGGTDRDPADLTLH